MPEQEFARLDGAVNLSFIANVTPEEFALSRANDPSYIRYHDFYRDKQGLLRFLDFIAINRFLSELFNLVGYF